MESLSFPRAPRRYRVRCDNIVAATNLNGSVGVLTPTRGFAITRVTPIGAAVLEPVPVPTTRRRGKSAQRQRSPFHGRERSVLDDGLVPIVGGYAQ